MVPVRVPINVIGFVTVSGVYVKVRSTKAPKGKQPVVCSGEEVPPARPSSRPTMTRALPPPKV